MFFNIFFFRICPKDIYANIVGESMHDVPFIFEFCLLCILQNTLAVYHLLLWIKSVVLWSCTSGTLGRMSGFQGKWSAGWCGEVARSKVKRLCSERGGQHPDFEGTAVVKGWNWTAWIVSLLCQSRSCSGLQPKSSQQLLSCCQRWPSNPKSLLHNTFSQHLCLGNANLWNKCPYRDSDSVLQRVEDWGSRIYSCHLKLRKKQQVKQHCPVCTIRHLLFLPQYFIVATGILKIWCCS